MNLFNRFLEIYHDKWRNISRSLGAAILADDGVSVNKILTTYFNSQETARLLLGAIVYDSDEELYPPAHYAVLTTKRNSLRAICNFTKDPESCWEDGDPPGRTLLMTAAKLGDIKTVDSLLNLGANKDSSVEFGGMLTATPLGFAIGFDFQKTAELLISKGAVFTINEALMAVSNNDKLSSFVKDLILENPELIYQRGGPSEITLLHLACVLGKLPTVEWLVENGSEVNATDAEDRTPLFWAHVANHSDAVNYLSKKGGTMTAESSTAQSPDPEKLEVTSIIERLEVMEDKLGIALGSFYASLVKQTWNTPADYGITINFDIMNSGAGDLKENMRIKAVAYNEVGQPVGQDDVILLKDDFMGFDSKSISLTADQAPSRIRLFPVKL